MPVTERNKTSGVVKSELDKYPYTYTCRKPDCGYHVACVSIESGIHHEQTHACPRQKRMKEGTMNMPSIHEGPNGAIPMMWEALDNNYAAYIVAGDENTKSFYGSKMRGMAEIMALVMKPYFNTGDEIITELLERAKDSERKTHGIGWIGISPEEGAPPGYKPVYGGSGYTGDPAHMADPPPGYPQDRIDAARKQAAAQTTIAKTAARSATPKPAAVPKVSEEEVKIIGDAHAGGFTEDILMAAYGKTSAEIKWALANYVQPS